MSFLRAEVRGESLSDAPSTLAASTFFAVGDSEKSPLPLPYVALSATAGTCLWTGGEGRAGGEGR